MPRKNRPGQSEIIANVLRSPLILSNREGTERLKAQKLIIGRKMGGRKVRWEWTIDVKGTSNCFVFGWAVPLAASLLRLEHVWYWN